MNKPKVICSNRQVIGRTDFLIETLADSSTVLTNLVTRRSVTIPAGTTNKKADQMAKTIGLNLKTVRKRNRERYEPMREDFD